MSERDSSTCSRVARILIVDDHPIVREGLRMRLAGQPGLEVCGEAADVTEALQQVAATNPDLAIIDIALKTGNGLDLIKRIRAHNHAVRMLVWSMYSESLYGERVLRAGAMGYITKEEATDKIIEAIHRVLEGEVYLSDPMAGHLLKWVVRRGDDGGDRPLVDALSDRELEVFGLVGHGVDTHGIAAKLRVSPKTVETYRARIKDKLHLMSSIELVRCAVEWVVENG